MAHNLRDIDTAVRYWANQIQSTGAAGNVFFRDGRIYSYGMHFCIARILPSGAVAVTTRGYSPSTRRHISKVSHAVTHRAVVYCNDPSDSALQNLQNARHAIADELARAEKPRIREATRITHRGNALRIAEQANAYLAALPADEVAPALPIDTSALESVRAELTVAEQAREVLRIEQQKQRAADLAESLQKWRTGALFTRTGLYEITPALRLSADRSAVETSHGAEIPVSDALKLWPMVQAARAGQREFTPGEPLGAYRLSKIRADGSIVVGCHDIPYSELEGIAVSLGLLETVES